MADDLTSGLAHALASGHLSMDALAELTTGEIGEAAIKSFFDTSIPQAQRRTRAAGLIHAVGADPDLLEGKGMRARSRAISLVEDAFGGQLRGWGVPESGEPFERFDALAALPSELQERLDDATAQMSSMDTVARVGGEFQRVLGTFRPLVQAVVPHALATVKLGDLLNAVAEVREADGPQFIASHGRATELLSSFGRDVADAGPFAQQYFARFVTALRSLLEAAYEASPATEPADIGVTTGGKRYPLLLVDAELRLTVRLTNAGRGQGLDVRLEDLDASGVCLGTGVVPIGTLMPGELASPSIIARAIGEEEALVAGRIAWSNSDGSSSSAFFEVSFSAQRSDVDWTACANRTTWNQSELRTSLSAGRTC